MTEYSGLVRLGMEALWSAYRTHEQLGEKGLEPRSANAHGETSLTGDIECEKAVIETFRQVDAPLRIISEEHGRVDLSRNPKYLAVLDGLDGTSVYKKSMGKGRYGTMFGIFSNINPNYEDYILGGIMEHSSGRLYWAVKNEGGFVMEDGKKSKLQCSSERRLDLSTIYADEFFDGAKNTTFIHDTYLSKLNGYKFLHENSSAIHYADLAQGEADLVLECTRKGNLEIAAAFGIVNEAGGTMVTIDGTSIGKNKYLELGQDRYIAIISASTKDLADELIRKISG